MAWAVENPPPLLVAGVGDMGRKPIWTTMMVMTDDNDDDGHMMMDDNDDDGHMMMDDDDDDDDDDAVDFVDFVDSFYHGPMGPWAHTWRVPGKNYFICILLL